MAVRPVTKVWISLTTLVAGSWVAFALAGGQAAKLLAERFGTALLRVAGGKFDDPALFILGRLREFLLLTTVAMVLMLLVKAVHHALKRWHLPRPIESLAVAAAILFALNGFVGVAGRTVLFWSLFYDRNYVDNFAQYQIKTALLREIKGRGRAILIGNSQTNTNIDEVTMNGMIGTRLWSTELTQPGARGFDLLTLTRKMPLQQGDLIICYLSEVFFYGDGSGGVAADFFCFTELPDVLDLQGIDQFAPGAIRTGLIGQALPLYRYRNSFSHKILGWSLVNLEQVRFDTSLESDLEAQARRRAPLLHEGTTSTFEKAAFTRTVNELTSKGCSTLLIAGHTHPALQRQMDPALRESMLQYLTAIQADGNGRVTVIDGSRLKFPVTSDFVDLVHFNKHAQLQFTQALVAHLTEYPSSFPFK
jgi:hypothetical protein